MQRPLIGHRIGPRIGPRIGLFIGPLVRTLIGLGIALTVALAGCAALPGEPGSADGAAPADKTSHTGDAQLDKLNQGYSLLHASASGLRLADKILLVKFESDRTHKVVSDISDTMAELTAQLEALPKRYPSIRIDLKPLPEIEERKQAAANRERVLSFAPVVGRTGPDFERTLLLTLSGGLNQMRFLTRVMADQERNGDRRMLLESAHRRVLQRYMETLKLLNEAYYKIDAYDPKDFQ